MTDNQIHRAKNRARIDERQVNELIGLAHGLVADGVLNRQEIEFLEKWLVANREVTQNPIIVGLLSQVGSTLRDALSDGGKAIELLDRLKRLTGGDFEIGEMAKSTSLPFCHPPPVIDFMSRRFCFTGTFAFGTRNECHAEVIKRGGTCGDLVKSTRYLVIGSYATESWIHSAFGRKIEDAARLRDSGISISIVSEQHWRSFL